MKTQLIQRHWVHIAAELRLQLDKCGLLPKALSEKAGINYDAAYRLLNGGLERRSKAALQLCNYFGINILINAKSTTEKLRFDIYNDIDRIWDGSEAHAKLLQKLIRSTRKFDILNKS